MTLNHFAENLIFYS
uniref:Uncharacterized protein n=1 Tax=Rhizophora mucronata TaxID=61149 RepID=A0A2P2QEA1_RHIMU